MLINEAKWLGEQIAKIPAQEISPCLNLGCQTGDYQAHGAPWIDQYIMSPLKNRGVKIVNTDLQEAPGVDIVGDLLDQEFQQRLLTMQFGSAICCNLLEHVEDINNLAAHVARIPRTSGWLFVSCPRAYPYHPDPIDNGFRPSPAELSALFPGFEQVAAADVVCETGWDEWSRSRFGGWGKLARLALPFINFRGWQAAAQRLGWISKHFSASCCLLKRSNRPPSL